MTNNDIKELPDFLDKYGRKIIITNYSKELTNFLDEYGVNYKIVENRVEETKNDIKELTDFLDKYGVDYEVVGGRVLSDTVNLDDRGITQLPDSIWNLKCLDLCLNNNKLEHLPDGFELLQCEYLYLFNNPLTSESQQLLYKMKSRGVNVIYQQTKQTRIEWTQH